MHVLVCVIKYIPAIYTLLHLYVPYAIVNGLTVFVHAYLQQNHRLCRVA